MAYVQNMQDETIVRSEPANKPVARIQLDSGISFMLLRANLPLTIGRANDCDICIPSGLISRHHCQLYTVRGVICLKDTSSNGTLVDSRLVRDESVSILSDTTVTFAGEVNMIIKPNLRSAEASPVHREQRANGERRISERRSGERRKGDRRQSVVHVNFDRRSGTADRRVSDRRNRTAED